jgi:hypothetical protein
MKLLLALLLRRARLLAVVLLLAGPTALRKALAAATAPLLPTSSGTGSAAFSMVPNCWQLEHLPMGW